MVHGRGEPPQIGRSRADLLRWSEALGALHIKTGTGLSGAPAPHERLVEELSILAGQAADAGTRIALEPMPPATIKTSADALAVISNAGAPNVGLLLNSWHVARAGVAFASLADLPGDRIFAVELRDAATDPVDGDLIVDGLDFFQAPGDGDLDIAGYIRAIRSTGDDGPWGVEIFSIANRARSLDDAARIDFEATAAAVREVEASERSASTVRSRC